MINLQISFKHISQINQWAELAYPMECCGLMAGRLTFDQEIEVSTIFPTLNVAQNPYKEYEVDPHEMLKVEKFCRERELEVLGVYHSHPDHPAFPSPTDIKLAIPHFTYLILSVISGIVSETKAWIPDKKQMLELPVFYFQN